MSISSAPASIAFLASSTFTSVEEVPNGKEITLQTFTSEPLSSLLTNKTLHGFTQTEAK